MSLQQAIHLLGVRQVRVGVVGLGEDLVVRLVEAERGGRQQHKEADVRQRVRDELRRRAAQRIPQLRQTRDVHACARVSVCACVCGAYVSVGRGSANVRVDEYRARLRPERQKANEKNEKSCRA